MREHRDRDDFGVDRAVRIGFEDHPPPVHAPQKRVHRHSVPSSEQNEGSVTRLEGSKLTNEQKEYAATQEFSVPSVLVVLHPRDTDQISVPEKTKEPH
jgi:hypothetical protein